MLLYMIILIFGSIGGTVGPLPYDLAECEFRAGARQDQIVRAYDSGTRVFISGRVVTPADVEHRCVLTSTRPKLEKLP